MKEHGVPEQEQWRVEVPTCHVNCIKDDALSACVVNPCDSGFADAFVETTQERIEEI